MDWNKTVCLVSDEALLNLCMDAIKRIHSNPKNDQYVKEQTMLIDACIVELEKREGEEIVHAN